MNYETFQNEHTRILDCEEKDPEGLNDYQKLRNDTLIPINEVGIERFRIPLNFYHEEDQTHSHHDCEASMFINLAKGKTGVNMSRFCHILQDVGQNREVNNEFFKETLSRFRSELRDYDNEELIEEAKLGIEFSYPMKQKSLKSDNWGWQYYNFKLVGQQKGLERLLEMTLNYEYSSTCPCSLSMSKQYEREYREGKTTEGNGIATAHSQRSKAAITITISLDDKFNIEELVYMARKALPTETQSLVKRVDEQAFAILNGENPMFVEHASRRLSLVLDQDQRIIDWKAKIEHIESLHSHNAVATIRKNKTLS